MMNKTTTILAMMALSLASATAGVEYTAPAPSGKGVSMPPPADPCAGPISYNSLEMLYANSSSSYTTYYRNANNASVYRTTNDDAQGLRLNFEYSPASNFYLRLTGAYDDADYWNSWGFTAGVGAYVALTENIHLAADGGLVWIDAEHDGLTDDDSDANTQEFGDANGPGHDNNGIYRRYSFFDDSDTGWYVRPHIRAKFSCFEIHAGATYVDVWNEEDWNLFVNVYYQIAQGWDITGGYTEHNDEDTWTIGARRRF